MAIGQSFRNKLWFGTEDLMQWMPTPLRGANTSPEGWGENGTLLNGGGYSFSSFGSHKQYVYEWPSTSSPEAAQKMKSYADGTYGRRLIYFVDPLTYETNILPARWADPSMSIDDEGGSLVYGLDPYGIPATSGINELPVSTATYDLQGVTNGFRGKNQAVFIPIPGGYDLLIGAVYTASGSNVGVYASPHMPSSEPLAPVRLTPVSSSADDLLVDRFTGEGVWLWVGKTSGTAGTVSIQAMIARLIPSVKTQSTMVAQNLFTNPNLVGDGTWAEVRRNLLPNPDPEEATGWISGSGVTTSPGDGFREALFESDYSSTTSIFRSNSVNAFMEPVIGTVYSSRVGVQNLSDWSIELRPGLLRDGATVPYILGTTVTLAPGEYRELEINYTYEEAFGDRIRVGLSRGSGLIVPEGSLLRVFNGWTVEAAPSSPDLFSGSSPDRSVDPDMRTRWLGEPGASESVMEIENIANMDQVSSAVAGVSTWNGEPAIRVITLEDTISPRPRFNIPVGDVRDEGTWKGTLHIAESTPGSDPRTGAGDPLRFMRPPSTDPGSYPLKQSWGGSTGRPSLTSTFNAYLYGTGVVGESVWYTDIGLFEGDYSGPAFAGDTGAVVINGKNHRTQWDGTPNNSTSSAWTMTPEFARLKKGPWIGGQGHSGCRFVGKPTYVENGPINGGQIGFAATFKEVGSWAAG